MMEPLLQCYTPDLKVFNLFQIAGLGSNGRRQSQQEKAGKMEAKGYLNLKNRMRKAKT